MTFFTQEPDDNVRFQLAGDSYNGKTHYIVSLNEFPEFDKMCIIDTTGKAKFHRHKLNKNSQVVRVKDNVELEKALTKLQRADDDGKMPFNVIVVDDWTTVYERLKVAADEAKNDGFADDDMDRVSEIKDKDMREWGKLKSIHSQYLRLLFDLNAHIILVAWEADEYAMKKNQKNGKLRMEKTGDTKAKIEKNIKYYIDISLILKKKGDRRAFKVVSDCSGTIKDKAAADPSVFVNAVKFLKENEKKNDAIEKMKEDEEVVHVDVSEGWPECPVCGEPTKPEVLRATKKKNGEPSCWKCATEGDDE